MRNKQIYHQIAAEMALRGLTQVETSELAGRKGQHYQDFRGIKSGEIRFDRLLMYFKLLELDLIFNGEINNYPIKSSFIDVYEMLSKFGNLYLHSHSSSVAIEMERLD
jgi:hypothetical protein